MPEIELIEFKLFRPEGDGDLASGHCKGIYGLHRAYPNGSNIKWILKKGVQDPRITPWFVVCLMFDDVKRRNRDKFVYDPENPVEYTPVNIMTDLRQWAIIDYPQRHWFSKYYLVQIVRDELLDQMVSALGPPDVEKIRVFCEEFVDSITAASG